MWGFDDNAIVLTARSGRAALKNRLGILGIEVGDEELGDIYQQFWNWPTTKKIFRTKMF